ncbi:MAG: hypothetical protein AAFX85_21130, partial [Pseudomonadota bacterium]
MLTSFGAAAFHAPNSSSVLNAVERRYYGLVSGFTNLARNAGNVIGVALATAMVSVIMTGQGFAPDLATQLATPGAAGDDVHQSLVASFDRGAQVAFWLLAGGISVILTLSLCFARDADAAKSSAH